MAEIKGRPDPIRVTEAAARRIKELVAREGRPNLKLRLAVAGGGCSGFRYEFSLDDRSFPDDVLVRKDGAEVAIDGLSLMYLLGAELDFVDDLTGAYFRVSNPNATSSCGCGNSFAI
ncbi:MAG: iron-sulfur cluster insertion protein ErpA [Geminicoccaceae bacterium]|nr:iron-sulfur cluster insertion protein ErpA [Geminicoccaceae bacterium]MCS7268387.1 iron-sulfur cluster insertion protein ErpA [Geminicoccaceae bacterium]MCX7629449.1 iron-sulfur cluster insertion protein ErpA [Geminicoccaceae bacterium]MDW8124280.1 iron-sulfur cluster insertion protein ErpA [Geminicoccaceae bacterium]MDW8341111.1 iron-sulfur cluster insertion protein ErpA [Geminicoccaceae bacterium]